MVALAQAANGNSARQTSPSSTALHEAHCTKPYAAPHRLQARHQSRYGNDAAHRSQSTLPSTSQTAHLVGQRVSATTSPANAANGLILSWSVPMPPMLATQSINGAASFTANARFPFLLVQPTLDALSPDFRQHLKALSEGIPQINAHPSREKKRRAYARRPLKSFPSRLLDDGAILLTRFAELLDADRNRMLDGLPLGLLHQRNKSNGDIGDHE